MEIRFVAVAQESLAKARDLLDRATQEIDVVGNVVRRTVMNTSEHLSHHATPEGEGSVNLLCRCLRFPPIGRLRLFLWTFRRSPPSPIPPKWPNCSMMSSTKKGQSADSWRRCCRGTTLLRTCFEALSTRLKKYSMCHPLR